MITLISDKDHMIVKDENSTIVIFIPSKVKGQYECDCPDNTVSKGIIKLVLEYGKLGLDFIKVLYNNYGQSLTVTMITTELSNNKSLTDKIRYRDLITKAEKYKIIIKYNTSWRLPKDNVKYLYNYLESLK